MDLGQMKEVFKEEYLKAENFYRKNKKLIFKIKKLEVVKKIIIPRQISLEEFNTYLQKWDREDISVK